MVEVNCPADGGTLKLDLEETRKNGISPVYYCERCGALFTLSHYGQKPNGWRTKKLLEQQAVIKSIPF